jgi:hypothetical protein
MEAAPKHGVHWVPALVEVDLIQRNHCRIAARAE